MFVNQGFDQMDSGATEIVSPQAAKVAQHLRDLAATLENGIAKPILRLGLGEGQGGNPKSAPREAGRADFLTLARAILKERDVRRQIFGQTLVDDPAWGMLVDLFEARLTRRTRCVKSVSHASGAPMTTALRYLSHLDDQGLIERYADPHDRRRTLVSLTDLGEKKMAGYFDRI